MDEYVFVYNISQNKKRKEGGNQKTNIPHTVLFLLLPWLCCCFKRFIK